ncbi:MAG: hypothetical protein JXQ71_17370 [Verrucomicrobia bacterium]|nr:hypothetical protein [Verrucomicrobiota bacterium]
MTDQEFNQLREAGWRRSLDPAEDARVRVHLAASSEAQQDWELEADLTQVLAQVPDAPLPTNFTRQVLDAVDREARAKAARHGAGWWAGMWPGVRLLPRLAGGLAVLLALAFLGYHQHEIRRQDRLTRALLHATRAHGLGQPGIFQDFDAIRRLGQVPLPADEELWLVLSQAPPR